MTNPAIRELAKRLSRLEMGVRAQNVPQLAASSVESGAIQHYDAAGQLTAVVGEQHDGTTAAAVVAGPPPPAPTGLDADGSAGTITASWSGLFDGGEVAPMDFTRVEVHLVDDEGADPDPLPGSATRVGTIESPGGGSLTFAATPGDHWVTLIARSSSGKASGHAELVQVTVDSLVDGAIFEQARADIEQAKIDIEAATSGPVDVDRISAEQMAAKVGAFVKVGVNQLTVTDTATIDTAVAQRMFVDIFAANKVTANELEASSVAAAIGSFVRIKAEQLDSGWLNASVGIGTGGSIIAGDWSKSYARIDENGFSTWMVAPDGTQFMSTSLGSATSNSLMIADSTGVPTASISPTGDISGSTVTSAGDMNVGGAPLIGQRIDYAGSTGASWLDTLPWGLAGVSNMGSTVASKSVSATTTEVITPLQVVTATVWPGRTCEVTMPFHYYANNVTSSAQAYLGLRVYYTVGTQASPMPADPTTSSSQIGYALKAYTASAGPVYDALVATVTPNIPAGGPVTMKIMVASSVKNASMAYSVPSGASWLMTVKDIGPYVPDTGYASGATAKSTFSSVWRASTSRSYDSTGADSSADYQQGILRHGSDSLTHSVFVCNNGAASGEKGKTISQALTGATVVKVEVGLQSQYWASATGGTVTLLPLNGTTIPASDTSPGDPKKSGVDKKFTARTQWQWVTVPTSWVSPSSTGIRIGPTWFFGDANKGYFANHQSTTAPPQIRITYTR